MHGDIFSNSPVPCAGSFHPERYRFVVGGAAAAVATTTTAGNGAWTAVACLIDFLLQHQLVQPPVVVDLASHLHMRR